MHVKDLNARLKSQESQETVCYRCPMLKTAGASCVLCHANTQTQPFGITFLLAHLVMFGHVLFDMDSRASKLCVA